MKHLAPRLVAGSAIALLAHAAPLAAQEDFMSADLERPLLVEDAFPLKFREWEVELGLRGGPAETGSGLLGIAELKSGLFLNGEVGLEIEAGVQDSGSDVGGSLSGIEAVSAHLLYGLSRETWGWPAFAGRVDVSSPGTGSFGREDWGVQFKGIATRSLGRLRLHANGGYALAGTDDGGDFWLVGVALQYPIGLFSRAILGDIYAELPTGDGRARVWVEFGTRWQLANRSVLDFGIATRLDEWEAGNANVQLVIGISRIFGIPDLVRVSPVSAPRIN